MRLNRVTIICLAIAGLLTSGVLIAQAYGFVSYENNNRMILWDNTRIVGYDLNFPAAQSATSGNIYIGAGKDLYIRKFMGLGCPDNYPSDTNCTVKFGDTSGNIFLQINQINNMTDLHLKSEASGMVLVGDPIIMGDEASNKYQRLILLNGVNLIATDTLPIAPTANSVYADNLQVNEFDQASSVGLTINNLKLPSSGYFVTERIISYTPKVAAP